MKYIIAILALAFFSFSTAVSQEAEIGKKAPNFKLTDSNGKTHSLSDFSGKYVVLEWVNFDCPFVVKHYSSGNMQSLQKKYTEKDVVWLSICSSADGKQGNFKSDEINEKIKEREAAMTAYLIDENGKVGKTYGAKTTPHLYIVSPKGELIYAGGIDDTPSPKQEDIKTSVNYISKALDEAMSGKQVEISTSKPYGCSVKYK